MRTTVLVRDLPLLADVGINQEEIGRLQPLVVSVKLFLQASAGETLADTIDYRRIVASAEAVAKDRIPLIETFARELGRRCLEWPQVLEARIIIEKPFALPRGTAMVEVTMGR